MNEPNRNQGQKPAKNQDDCCNVDQSQGECDKSAPQQQQQDKSRGQQGQSPGQGQGQRHEDKQHQ
jgi:hypothetical protein